ncbi:MAG: nucleoside 2-deoxyribosyltransferase [Nitrososphaerota archaeon]|jgi:hypothetical protein|nr:nucleoside 2-deoxyribosyltransferase [Nitrososphaerota archaeon]MDG6961512.1 nucleoside 2-deoxyribosyltransferase [Nitrososphaerota archaeon]MDG7015212.1 nucleoside 2-deoxyribosyltransferase [Nitrososphaerota archaeon]WGO49970.1 MAG: nucleoside 2-deoxyribosyltransferase [Nitrososphaerota archaeon]
MKVYLSVPMITNRALPRAKEMARAVADAGHTITSPWVLGPLEKDGAVNIFRRDKDATEASDILVADVTDPSIGVGMEIMAAYKAGKRIILLAKKGKVTSGMLAHMDRREFVEYEAEEDVYPSLLRAL